MTISGLPFGLAFLIRAMTAIAIAVQALRRWSYAAELQAEGLDRLAGAFERGAPGAGERPSGGQPAPTIRTGRP